MSWEMKPHTRAKHIILNNYLKAWFPIMSFTNSRIIYLDGFAGPGIYKGGEDGSPIMAIKIAKEIFYNHYEKLKNKDFIFLFIEAKKDHYESLLQELEKIEIPSNFKVFVENKEFVEIANSILKSLETRNSRLAPTFAFIDPFGTKGVPFNIVKKLMSYRKCEVLFNHMAFGVVRSAEVTDHTELYGTDKWKNLIHLQGREKHKAFTDLYKQQLKDEANVKYVRSFNVRNRKNSTLFDLIYSTNNIKGLEKMKQAMWKADPSGNFYFRDTTKPGQLVLFEIEPDFFALEKMLIEQFSGKTVEIDEIDEFVICDTPFLKSHIRQRTLTPMEKKGRIVVSRPGNSNKGFVKGTKISF